MKTKVIHVDGDSITFSNGLVLSSDHQQDCCESHYLSFSDLKLEDFDGLEFDLTDESFFARVPDYGIRLIPINGHQISVPGYGSNNGYYGSNIDLVLSDGRRFDVSECQVISE
jgi:hypothetical protein